MGIRLMQKEKMLMQVFEPIALVSEEYWYRVVMYSAVSKYA
jgi:hypothetical protein